MKLKPVNLNIRVSEAVKAQLEQVAAANETTPSEMMRQLIREAYQKLQEKRQ
jgi:predicted transcriptional regulator